MYVLLRCRIACVDVLLMNPDVSDLANDVSDLANDV